MWGASPGVPTSTLGTPLETGRRARELRVGGGGVVGGCWAGNQAGPGQMLLGLTLVCLNFLSSVKVTNCLVTFPPPLCLPGQYKHSGRCLPLAEPHRGQQDHRGGGLLLSQ